MTFSTSIPTMYKGTRFRSRLEARWAAFFDVVRWEWAYEPIDLRGYIPDFLLRFPAGDLLVEVKPALSLSELRQHDAKAKIISSGWAKESLIVGTMPFESESRDCVIGVLDGRLWSPADHWFGDAIIMTCDRCKRTSLFHQDESYACRVTGCYEGDHHIGSLTRAVVDAWWAEAGNLTQWRPS